MVSIQVDISLKLKIFFWKNLSIKKLFVIILFFNIIFFFFVIKKFLTKKNFSISKKKLSTTNGFCKANFR